MPSPLTTVVILSNGLTLAVALGFLLIVLWHDTRKELNQFFAVFLFFVMLWNVGALLLQAGFLVSASREFLMFSLSITELGFVGASIAMYALLTVLIGAQTRRFRLLAFASLLLVLIYRVVLILTVAPLPPALEPERFTYNLQSFSVFFFFIYDGFTLFLVWRFRRKVRAQSLVAGIVVFILGQSLGLFNSALELSSLSVTVSSVGTLIVSFALLRREIITPLSERVSQVETMHRVSVAITSRLGLGMVLNEIVTQAAEWLNADAAGLFLNREGILDLATVFRLPPQFLHTRLLPGQGVAGTVAARKQSIHLNHYRLDWRGEADLPLAHETFGSVVCVPMIYDNEVIGVLMVIAGLQGRLFSDDDVHLLELLAAQAAVAIAHSHLFEKQSSLLKDLEAARSQLEAVLTSTENPVIAVNRDFHLIFANPAAYKLFDLPEQPWRVSAMGLLPSAAFPPDFRAALRDLYRQRAHVYEVSLDQKTYLCHLGRLGDLRTAGWVAVLNDVTELKELDRMKSEMVRMTSHDLKNPLQAAMANLELLSDDVSMLHNDEIQQSVNNIEKQLTRMNRIISGILDLERVRLGIKSAEVCNPRRIALNSLESVQEYAHEQAITLNAQLEECPAFLGDAEQFERALTNLLENAIKFTSAGGTVTLIARAEDGEVVFVVQDTGVGIPEAMQTQVFERFFRGRQKGVEHVSGSGLGLSLVKAIVENHRGRVQLESQEGIGSTFRMIIPAAS